MMPEISTDTTDDTLQLSKGQKTGQEDTEVSLVTHYPLVIRGRAGPLVIIQPDWFLDHAPHAIQIGAEIQLPESVEA
ncbi:MAG: hypothetical protein ABR512_15790 [Desulfopila sp.]